MSSKVKHTATSRLLLKAAAEPVSAEEQFKTALRDFRRATKTLMLTTEGMWDDCADSIEEETDPAVANRVATLQNTLGAFRHLCNDLLTDGQKVLNHFRQVRGDIESLEQNCGHYKG